RFLGRAGEAHGGGERHADQHVRGLDGTGRKVVADGGPVGTLRDGRVDAVFLEEALLVGDDDGRAVRQRDHAEVDIRRLGGVGGGAGRGGPAFVAEGGPEGGGAGQGGAFGEKLAAVKRGRMPRRGAWLVVHRWSRG